jgi:hypothetical protein
MSEDQIICPVCGKGTLSKEAYRNAKGIDGEVLKSKWMGTYSRSQSNGWIYKDDIEKEINKIHGVIETTKIGKCIGDDDTFGMKMTLLLDGGGGVIWEFWRWEDIIEFAMRAKRTDLTNLRGTPVLAYFTGKGTWGNSIIGLEVNESLVL